MSDVDPPMFGLRQASDPIVTAIAYRVTLVRCDENHPLRGRSYFGQAVRGGTVDEVKKARWGKEKSDAKNGHHEVGFLAVLRVEGEDAFDWEVLDSRRGPRAQVQKWACKREIELIAENGGPLRDMDEPLEQTLNLTKGGKCVDPDMWWHVKEALCTKSWKRFQKELLAYVAEHGTAHVPRPYVAPSGYRLGVASAGLRNSGELLVGRTDEAARREWLTALPGWSWNAYDNKWTRFLEEVQKLVDTTGSAYASKKYVTDDGYKLGEMMVLFRGSFVFAAQRSDPDVVEWFENQPGWLWDAKSKCEEATQRTNMNESLKAWERFKPEILLYVAEYGTTLVNVLYVSASGYRLGHKVNNIRSQKQLISQNGKLIPDRVEWLETQLPDWTMDGRASRKRKILEFKLANATSVEDLHKIARGEANKKRYAEKYNADLLALRATFVPKAKWNEVLKYRKDRTVAKAHLRLEAQAVAASVMDDILGSAAARMFGEGASSSA